MISIWKQPGTTLSDKSARKEFGLTQQEIYDAMRAGKLQFQQNTMHGNPWFRHRCQADGRAAKRPIERLMEGADFLRQWVRQIA